MKLHLNDQVEIIAGKDKGKTGKVTQVFQAHNKAAVEGFNIRYRHIKPRRQNEKGQRLEYSAPFEASNVMVLDPKTSKTTRINYKILADGKKVRISTRSKEAL